MSKSSPKMASTQTLPFTNQASASISSGIKTNKNEDTNVAMADKASRDLSTSLSSSSSITSYRINDDADDDTSSFDTSSDNWERIHNLLVQLTPFDGLLQRDSISTVVYPISECPICLEESLIRPLSCCSSTVCSKCIHTHLSTHINEAQIRIACPACSHIYTREEILLFLSETCEDDYLSDRYKRFYADINREPNIKTCPKCCAIKEFDKKLFEGLRSSTTIPRHVKCDECNFDWCFSCHAPWHDQMTCKEYSKGEKLLRVWAAEINNNQQNARQCPRCKVFISRNGGCPHMTCSKCSCDFCYNCGKRRYGMKFLGSHDSRLSPFGCKYNLCPDKPILRYAVRGLVAGATTIAAPVAAVGAIALLAVGTTIGAPTYGTYRLVKHIRKRKRANVQRARAISTNANHSEEDEFNRAIEASMETYRYEEERRKERLSEYQTDEDYDTDRL